MEVTWLRNSGYAIEYGDKLLVVDCYDPLAQPMLRDLSGYAAITMLASHAHGDHYSKDIYRLAGNIAYVLSFDIEKHPGATSLAPGGWCKVHGVTICAFGSTDEGVSFLLTWKDGTAIFHAGDLNNWHWRDDGNAAYTAEATAAYHRELDRIRAEVAPGALDLACFPVDPRMGTDYYRGAVEFAEALKPKAFLPMHFGEQFDPPAAFYREMAAHTKVHSPHEPFRLGV